MTSTTAPHPDRTHRGPSVDAVPGDAVTTSGAADASASVVAAVTTVSGVGADASTSGVADASASGVATDQAPLGLPVLAELPALGAALQALTDADRLAVDAVLLLARLRAGDEVETHTGVPMEHWLGIAARQTRLDRRLLLRLCRQLDRFPALRRGAEQGRVSFAQLRGISLRLKDAPTAIDADLDRWLDAAIEALDPGTDPDVLVRQVEQAIVELAPAVTADAEREAGRSRSLVLMPRLDGSGGTAYLDEDALGFAILDAATAVRREQLGQPDGAGTARADNLRARLLHACDPAAARPGSDDDGGAPEARSTAARSTEGNEADGAAAPVAGPDGAQLGTGDGGAGPNRQDPEGAPPLPPLKLLARVPLASLLDQAETPAELLTRLVGGRLRLTAAATRELVDARGAELRAIVVDDLGSVVGVGRTTRVPPGWLRDAAAALHDTCTGPLCERPARDADLDHARPWWPARPGDAPGRTDLDNLGPLCAGSNRSKEAAGWTAVQRGDGRRTWYHPRSGLTVGTVPATWRPPGLPRPGPRTGRGAGPPGSDPSPPIDAARRPDGIDPPAGSSVPASRERPAVHVDDDGHPIPF
jgi:hypothetical protein